MSIDLNILLLAQQAEGYFVELWTDRDTRPVPIVVSNFLQLQQTRATFAFLSNFSAKYRFRANIKNEKINDFIETSSYENFLSVYQPKAQLKKERFNTHFNQW